jgi:hypothetical protein
MRCAILFAALSLAAGVAAGETLYKLISPDGKVTYSSEAPKEFDGKVIKLEIDPNANTSEGRRVAPKPGEKAKSNEEILQSGPKAAPQDKLAAAKGKLEQARQAYEQARDNPGPDDVQRVGNLKGGARPVFSEEYQKKLAKLEAQVKAAQEEVDRLERGL